MSVTGKDWCSTDSISLKLLKHSNIRHRQLDDNRKHYGQDPSQNYSHKELAKITGSLSHTLIATLKLSDKHAAQRQQELTSAQRRIEQLEREAQDDRKGPMRWSRRRGGDNRLKETLEATSHEMQQSKRTSLIVQTSYSMQRSY